MVTSRPGAAPRPRRTYAGPDDPELRRQWLRERRAVVRAHHPDLGGDPAVLDRRLGDVDDRYRRAGTPSDGDGDGDRDGVIVTSRPRLLARTARRARRRLRRLHRAGTARLPTGWPGRRRYFDL